MTITQTYAIAAVNAALGALIFFICFCRVVVTNVTVLKRVRLKFVLLGPAALAFGLSPLWGDYPGIISPLLLLAIVIGLLAETYQWRNGPPNSVKINTMPAELRDQL